MGRFALAHPSCLIKTVIPCPRPRAKYMISSDPRVNTAVVPSPQTRKRRPRRLGNRPKVMRLAKCRTPMRRLAWLQSPR